MKDCSDKPQQGAPWAIQRTVRLENAIGAGTGVVVSPDGFILTAAHVVARGAGLQVVFEDDTRVEAVVVRSSLEADLALVRVARTDLPCMRVNPAPAQVGSDVFVIGSPGGEALTHSVTKGIVSSYRQVDGRVLVQTDASINAGNSGGPLVGHDGTLAGIVSFKVVGHGVEGLGFAIASSEVGRELSIRFGAATSQSLLEAQAVPLAAAPARHDGFEPKIEFAEGTRPTPRKHRYRLGYKAAGFTTPAGILGGTNGIVLLAIGLSLGTAGVLSDADSGAAPLSIAGLATTAGGVGLLSIALGRSSVGPITEIQPTEEE